MTKKVIPVVVLLSVWMGCSAQGGRGGGGGGLFPSDDAGTNGASCSTMCARQASAHCPRFDMNACVSECTRFTSVPACTAEATAALRCGITANFTCNADGDTESSDCEAEGEAFALCVLTSAHDAGVDVSFATD